MSRYTVLPCSNPRAGIEFESTDGAAALHAASRMGFGEADVFRDGAYLFSVNRQGNQAGFWGIFQKPELARKEAPIGAPLPQSSPGG